MKYSFLENRNYNNNNNFKNSNIVKRRLLEYDQFDNDEEYDEETNDYDPQVDDMIDKRAGELKYGLEELSELKDILLNENISLEEKEKYIKYNENLLNREKENRNTLLCEICEDTLDYSHEDNISIINLLLKYGTDINGKSFEGQTALYTVCNNTYESKDKLGKKLVKLLLAKGADVDIQEDNGFTALMICCLNDTIELIELLLTHGADANIENGDGCTALSYACQYGRIKIIESLLKHGANPNTQINYSKTPILNFCVGEYVDNYPSTYSSDFYNIIKILLEYGANPNSVDENDNVPTPLLMSVGSNCIELAKLLLEHGADINIEDNYGETVFEYTFSDEMEELLLKYGAKERSELN